MGLTQRQGALECSGARQRAKRNLSGNGSNWVQVQVENDVASSCSKTLFVFITMLSSSKNPPRPRCIAAKECANSNGCGRGKKTTVNDPKCPLCDKRACENEKCVRFLSVHFQTVHANDASPLEDSLAANIGRAMIVILGDGDLANATARLYELNTKENARMGNCSIPDNCTRCHGSLSMIAYHKPTGQGTRGEYLCGGCGDPSDNNMEMVRLWSDR